MSFIYDKCNDHLRRPFWDKLINFSNLNIPWCTIEDFNVITSPKEKQEGLPNNMNESFEFINVIEACGLMDLGYSGQHFTWCNQRSKEHRVWKRLDRDMVNDQWLEDIPQSTINHLPSVGSDHCPLLMEVVVRSKNISRYFKFLQWTYHVNFGATIKECWDREVSGNPMYKLQQKNEKVELYS
ncbi:hypothetical protein RDI58_000985 [Solanum bulbocastanum]|uniref:Uncharacterized protein n=1 Tax=Solanum bulbocastanum TaxID=147425 RepID=A0AAN8UBX3_SOLBU